ncbi:ArsR family transcriptional regulator [Paenibacillus filicis]|uniref:ArsR family transcriptional regulator n=1 Tax=Paenibacillus gyeongsangnamensis TaxID=3388067 RepID=A0ABT4QBL0_9BACL|nr:ArsR family transcriptional regulator [Paenibacillus filicis]MCZ8514277.1 ArsR family transcriptional regulator [Paenibacillus filicis]
MRLAKATEVSITGFRDHTVRRKKSAISFGTMAISACLNDYPSVFRRHLNSLEKDGLIECDRIVHQAMGRPTAVYRLTDAAEDLFPKKYHLLALDLLHELIQETGPDMVDVLFKRRKGTLQQKYAEQIKGKKLEDRVAVLADIQNESGYMAKWEKLESSNDEEEFIITEHNCPISHIANQYEHACNCELDLFESLLDADVKRSTCLAKGDHNCTYKIKPRLKDRSTT